MLFINWGKHILLHVTYVFQVSSPGCGSGARVDSHNGPSEWVYADFKSRWHSYCTCSFWQWRDACQANLAAENCISCSSLHLTALDFLLCKKRDDHLSGKPGNVREFDSCQGNVRDVTKSQGSVREKILSGKSGLKLFIVSCIFVSIQVFSRSVLC